VGPKPGCDAPESLHNTLSDVHATVSQALRASSAFS